MKVRRSDRLIDMTRYLLERPHTLIPLTFFSKRYESAKSSISEDLAIVRRTFAQRQTGILETVPGAAGGVRYIPIMGEDEAENFIAAMAKRLSETDRLLPGDSKITEGSTVSVNYVSGSSARIEKMELSKRSLPANSRVLIVDDFMKGGGTVNGMKALIDEFNAKMVGITVFAEGKFDGDRMVNDYTSLIRVDKVDTKANTLHATAGNFLSQNRQLLEVSHQ